MCSSPNLRPKARCCCGRDVLVAEKDHEIFGERAMDLVHLAVGARIVRDQPADVDARYLRADDRRELFDRDGLIGLFFAGRVAIARTLLAGERAHGASSDSLFCAIVSRMERSAIRDSWSATVFEAVIASEAKQSSFGAATKAGLLRRFAPRNDGGYSFAISPHVLREVWPVRSAPLKTEGAGKAGCALHPRSRVQKVAKKRTRAYRFSGSSPAFPAQWFYGL